MLRGRVKSAVKGVLLTPETKKFRKRIKKANSKTFKKKWPEILTAIIAHPEWKYKDVWAHFSTDLVDVISFVDFKSRMKKNGMTLSQIRKATSIKEQAQVAIRTFHEVKKEYAERHMQRIHKKLDEIHGVVDKMPVHEKNVGYMVDLVSRLNKEGRLTYDIGDDVAPDQRKTSLAVLIGWNPPKQEEKMVSVTEISSSTS